MGNGGPFGIAAGGSVLIREPLCPLTRLLSESPPYSNSAQLWYKKTDMPDFEANVQNVQQRLGRRLSGQELRLLQLWDSITASQSREGVAVIDDPESEGESSNEPCYEGRFKIAFSNGHYDVFFVCASVLFRGVAVDRKEDVMAFLTQPPIDLDEMLVRQAIAAAEHMKPTQINYAVSVPDVVLRSMGFERA